MEEKLQDRLKQLVEAEARMWAELHQVQGRIAETRWIIANLLSPPPEEKEVVLEWDDS